MFEINLSYHSGSEKDALRVWWKKNQWNFPNLKTQLLKEFQYFFFQKSLKFWIHSEQCLEKYLEQPLEKPVVKFSEEPLENFQRAFQINAQENSWIDEVIISAKKLWKTIWEFLEQSPNICEKKISQIVRRSS